LKAAASRLDAQTQSTDPVAFENGLACRTMGDSRIRRVSTRVLTGAKGCRREQCHTRERHEMVGHMRATSERALERAQEGFGGSSQMSPPLILRSEITELGYPVTSNDPAFVDFAGLLTRKLLAAENTSTERRRSWGRRISLRITALPAAWMFIGRMPERPSRERSCRAVPLQKHQ